MKSGAQIKEYSPQECFQPNIGKKIKIYIMLEQLQRNWKAIKEINTSDCGPQK